MREIEHIKFLFLILRVVINHHPQGFQNCHASGRGQIELVAHDVFQQFNLNETVRFGNSDSIDEFAYSGSRVATAPHGGKRRHTRVGPTVYVTFLDQLAQFALAHHCMGQVEAGKLNLLWMEDFKFVEKPVIERTVVLILQRAHRMGDALQRIGLPMCEVIHGIDAPLVTGAVMFSVQDAIHDRVAHVHIGRGHVDFCSQGQASVIKLTRAHTFEQVQTFFNGAVAPWAVSAGFSQRAAIFAHFFS